MEKKSHLGIYAVIQNGENICLVKKTKGPYKNMWDLPGGRQEFGETIFQTLQREVFEETLITITSAYHLNNTAFVVKYLENGQTIALHHTCLIYTVDKYDASKFQEHINYEDVEWCRWIPKTSLPYLSLSSVVKSIIDLI